MSIVAVDLLRVSLTFSALPTSRKRSPPTERSQTVVKRQNSLIDSVYFRPENLQYSFHFPIHLSGRFSINNFPACFILKPIFRIALSVTFSMLPIVRAAESIRKVCKEFKNRHTEQGSLCFLIKSGFPLISSVCLNNLNKNRIAKAFKKGRMIFIWKPKSSPESKR